MEKRRLSTEVLNKLSKLTAEELIKDIDVNYIISQVSNEILNNGDEIAFSKAELSMLHSIDLKKFLDRMNDDSLPSGALATPLT